MMQIQSRIEVYCVVGAGASGLTAAKNLKMAGIAFEIIEQEDEVGGNWYYGKPNSSVYQSTHLISSKEMTAFTDFPMPANYPDYPSHSQVCDYLRSYAKHFGLYEHIEFNTSVKHIERTEDGLWDITVGHRADSAADDETFRYGGLVIANGHLWDPKLPQFPGEFHGTWLHSTDYKTPEILLDQRVLVVGGGNSGCDIAVEAAQNAAATFHSTRRGYWYAPKYTFGRPTDTVNELPIKLGLPLWLRRILIGTTLKLIVGDLRRYGLRKPDHKLLEAHPVINQQLIYYMGHGRIVPKPDVAELCGDQVRFADGTRESIDLIIYATGFKISFPFIDSQYLNWNGSHPDLYLHVFHPEYDNLFVIGMIQSDSGQFWITDLQSQLMTQYILAKRTGLETAERFRTIIRTKRPDLGGGIKYLDSTRHYVEIAHHVYRKLLKQHLKMFQ